MCLPCATRAVPSLSGLSYAFSEENTCGPNATRGLPPPSLTGSVPDKRAALRLLREPRLLPPLPQTAVIRPFAFSRVAPAWRHTRVLIGARPSCNYTRDGQGCRHLDERKIDG